MIGENKIRLLFCEDYQSAIILNRIKGINVVDSAEYVDLHVGGGEDWHALVSWAVDNGFNGLENLALIPGCVGSSPIQNIGALKGFGSGVATTDVTLVR